jgi:hypothetical protein
MQRSISVMVGKGSVNHNSRKFNAENTDPERSNLNQSYCNKPIKEVYHELFDEAVKIYNAKQSRGDRCIDDYYEKTRTGKQEKPFHEIILQIGNCDNMNAKTDDGLLAAKILDNFMQEFQSRNPNLLVFSAHLHMDEATPHLHIDFVPFTTASSRGLDTRVSLKQALATQGFKGGSRRETEWNQWVSSEKEQLALVMERNGIHWEQKGTHQKHLSVLEYEKKERAKEVAFLETKISKEKNKLEGIEEEFTNLQSKIDNTKNKVAFIDENVNKYEIDLEWQLPEPSRLTSAKSYREKVVEPLFFKFKQLIRSLVSQYFDVVKGLKRANKQIWNLSDSLERYKDENDRLKGVEGNYNKLCKFLGIEKTDKIIKEVTEQEKAKNAGVVSRKNNQNEYER